MNDDRFLKSKFSMSEDDGKNIFEMLKGRKKNLSGHDSICSGNIFQGQRQNKGIFRKRKARESIASRLAIVCALEGIQGKRKLYWMEIWIFRNEDRTIKLENTWLSIKVCFSS